MSSHHIVREAQEPALLIWQAADLTGEHLAQLLEWSPTLITKEDTLEAVLAQGIKVDAVVCTSGREAALGCITAAQSHVRFISAAAGGEILSAVLRHLAAQGQQAIHVLTTSPETHLLTSLATQEFLPNVVVLTAGEKWSLYRSGSFSKWLPAEDAVYVQGVQAGVHLHSKGFSSDMEETAADVRQLLQVKESGTKSIEANGPFWVIESLT